MKEKLNPCPFCGGEAVHYAPSMRDMANGDCHGSIVCKNCDVFMQSDSDFDNDDLVKRWNTRPFECESWCNAMSEQKAYNAEAVKRVDMLTAENKEILDILDRLVNLTDYANLVGVVHDAKEALKKARGEK